MKRIEESLGSVVRIGSVRSFGGGVLVGVELWVGWCWLGRVVSRTEELRKYAWVRKIVPVNMVVVMGWLGRSFGLCWSWLWGGVLVLCWLEFWVGLVLAMGGFGCVGVGFGEDGAQNSNKKIEPSSSTPNL